MATLRALAQGHAIRLDVVVFLENLHLYIEEGCPDAVRSAVAFGRFLDVFGGEQQRRQRRLRDGIELLVVTTVDNIYQAHELLAEKVFGPLLLEFLRMPRYHVWTVAELIVASEHEHQLWQRASSEGVVIFGEPLGTDGVAGIRLS